jgi:hypothetical protein
MCKLCAAKCEDELYFAADKLAYADFKSFSWK